MIEWNTIYITFKLAIITTSVLLLVGIPLAYWLAYGSSKLKFIFEALIALPLVLPPTVLGFYLLIAFSSQSSLGKFLDSHFNLSIAFTFSGLVIGSVIYSLPFMIQPIQAGFQQLSPSLKEASYTLGKSRWQTLTMVLLPNIKSALLTGIVLSFAHTIGEFGVVLMIGGNLDETRVASIAIFDSVNRLDYATAHSYSLLLLLFSFVILALVYFFNKKAMTSFR
ncbi:MAG: molybdate ABC transporter permease subunit [Reichenbachiella sp.]|uniref:molybdate ABC transporter permease subunit n=1 Tax=Reichenbachiella sp. TaxID=2184521 RepID=UPI0029666E53|nr:molybdate ABC transporter permease subunit [Reichenbachiella sp.]MDW3209131.1 molybdate ABC transporter permease subunit [Reichenbachiella sp.]